jgi:hypothetical protein
VAPAEPSFEQEAITKVKTAIKQRAIKELICLIILILIYKKGIP